jgi:hypothetical protein
MSLRSTVHKLVPIFGAIVIGVVLTLPAAAQQVDCTVQVNYESVTSANKDLLVDFANDVRNYVNNYQWGSEQIQEKVKCTLDIFIQQVTGENRYIAQVFVGSQRPIYGSNKGTAVVRLLDEVWEFTYIKGRPINHTPNNYNDLTSFLDFYIYLILGYDYDTYENLGGTPWFQKALDVASLGRSSGQKGWQLVTTGYSRTQLVTELLNPSVAQMRTVVYKYHFSGLDSLAADRPKAIANIAAAVEKASAARKSVEARNLAVKTFFDTKYLELADILLEYPDPTIYIKLGRVDPYHQMTYEEYRTKKR